VGAINLVFRTQLRRRWQSWLAVAILISLVGGVVLAAAAGGRRTQSAFPGFVAAHGFDAEVYAEHPLPTIARLHEVTAVSEDIGADTGQPMCSCPRPINPSDFSVVEPATGISPFKLVSGRLPDPSNPNEVLASFTLQKDAGVQLGSVIHVPFYAHSQAAAVNNATGPPPKPTGPTRTLRVVGFEASEVEFPSGTTPTYLLYATRAFDHVVIPRTAVGGYIYFIRLRHYAADLPQLSGAVSRAGGFLESLDGQEASIETSIHPQAIGWWLLAALAALVGLAVIGQALGRQSIAESEDYPTMAALGVERRQLIGLGIIRNLVLGVAGASGALLVAVLLSPVAPLGEARAAENSTGITFDPLVLPLGALITVAMVFGLGLWPAVRAARTSHPDRRAMDSRPSVVVSRLAAAGAPPSMVIGVRHALERRSGNSAVPVGSALLGTVLAVVALCGTAVFGASLSHLTATPRLYGDPFQLNISNPSGNGLPDPVLLKSLEHNSAVIGITHGIALPAISINGVTVGAIAGAPIRGRLPLSTVNGHLPSGDGQIGLGVSTMHQVGAQLGSVVQVTASTPSGKRRTVPFRVVSQVSLPVLGNAVSLGTGAIFTLGGYEAAACTTAPKQASCRQQIAHNVNGGTLAQFVPGPRGQAAINYYLDHYRTLTAVAITPTSLINFGEAVNFPLIFGAMLAVFGGATLLHLLVVSVAGRRREVGLLRAVGFVNGQVASTVAWQSTTLALVGIVIGVPLGIVVGQAVWMTFANNLGAVPVSVVPTWLIAALGAGVLVVANVIAVGPALIATRSKAGDLLRTS
jgi:hypothetical protein